MSQATRTSAVGGFFALLLLLAGAAWAQDAPGLATPAAFDPAPYVMTDGGRSVLLGRYSTTSSVPPPDLVEPLDVVVALTFPRQLVSSVGEAVNYTLLRTGYRFDDGGQSEAARTFLALPLPESQRQIGPYPARAVLDVLMGTAWQARIDPASRTVRIASRLAGSSNTMAAGRAKVKPAVPESPTTNSVPASSAVASKAAAHPAGQPATQGAVTSPQRIGVATTRRGNLPWTN